MEDGRKDSSGTIILNEEEDKPLLVVTSSNGGCVCMWYRIWGMWVVDRERGNLLSSSSSSS